MKKGNAAALFPIVVFLALFIGIGAVTGDFYKMPAVVGFMIALLFAFLQNPKLRFEKKLDIMAHGAGDINIMIMVVIFLLAGAFSASIKAAGGADAAVNFGLSILPSGIAVFGVFLVCCFISTSMGTSVGTIVALAPIAVGISEKTGIPMALCIGSVVCGAMFGDNLSMISDTTIAATRTQGCEMKDKFRENFKIALPPAILTAVIFLMRTMGGQYQVTQDLHYDFIRIVPYLVVLIGALLGVNVILLLAGGTALSLGVGLFYGDFTFFDTFQIIGDGMASMFEISIISIMVGAIIALIRENGGIDWILSTIRHRMKTKRGAELGIAALSGLVDCATANNTVAIVIASPIAKEIADEYGIEPKRTASLLDIFTSALQGVIPYGAQLLYAADLTGLTPFDIIPNCYYPMLLAVSALGFILLDYSKKKAAV